MNEPNPLHVFPDQDQPRLGVLLPVYGEGIRPEGDVEFVITQLSAANIKNFWSLMQDLQTYSHQLPGRAKLTFENARARYCDQPLFSETKEPLNNEGSYPTADHQLPQHWSRCALEAAREEACGQWIGIEVLKLFKAVEPEESICHVTSEQVSWETAPYREGGSIYTGGIQQALLLEGWLALTADERIPEVFEKLVDTNTERAVKVLEQGVRPRFGKQPARELLHSVDPQQLTRLQTHPDPDIRQRTLRVLGKL